jgi:hypothetical protein
MVFRTSGILQYFLFSLLSNFSKWSSKTLYIGIEEESVTYFDFDISSVAL